MDASERGEREREREKEAGRGRERGRSLKINSSGMFNPAVNDLREREKERKLGKAGKALSWS